MLATETRKDSGGTLRPGSVVWLLRAGSLIRAAPEQLLKASSLEVQIEECKGPIEIPWTMTSLVEGGKGP